MTRPVALAADHEQVGLLRPARNSASEAAPSTRSRLDGEPRVGRRAARRWRRRARRRPGRRDLSTSDTIGIGASPVGAAMTGMDHSMDGHQRRSPTLGLAGRPGGRLVGAGRAVDTDDDAFHRPTSSCGPTVRGRRSGGTTKPTPRQDGDMTPVEIDALADRLLRRHLRRRRRRGPVVLRPAMRGLAQLRPGRAGADANLAVLGWLGRHVAGLRYDEIRRILARRRLRAAARAAGHAPTAPAWRCRPCSACSWSRRPDHPRRGVPRHRPGGRSSAARRSSSPPPAATAAAGT